LWSPRCPRSFKPDAAAGSTRKPERSKQSETFKIMERRLLKVIINPAMIVTWLAGLYLAWAVHWFSAGWLHAK
jgi:uncharacterized membrane protein